MLNKVELFVMFGPKCIFDASKRSITSPLMSHGLLLWCLYFLSGQGQFTVHTCQWRDRKLLD